MTVEIFSSSKLFLRASYVVEFVSDEYTKYRKYDMNFESNLTQLSDYICHLNTSSRRASEGERMILGIYTSYEYSHSFSAEKIISFSKNNFSKNIFIFYFFNIEIIYFFI